MMTIADQIRAASLADQDLPAVAWLTPETAYGATLPCGATVVRAEPRGDVGNVACWFDRSVKGYVVWHLHADGSHVTGDLPNLTPPPAQPEPGVMVTREMLAEAMAGLRVDHHMTADTLADALGDGQHETPR